MSIWAIVPAAGKGSRIQPLACSKELLPLCSSTGTEPRRPRAVSEYLLERLVRGGATRICFVISAGKSDIVEYHGGDAYGASLCYAVQPEPLGLCDAIFRAAPFVDPASPVLIGLPDTIWFPQDALQRLPDHCLSFLLFPVDSPQRFDAVVTDDQDNVIEVQVKSAAPTTHWIWGALKMPGTVLQQLQRLWIQRNRSDEFLGTLVNAWLRAGGCAVGVRAGSRYDDIGTMEGYIEAMRTLSEPTPLVDDRSEAHLMP